jgi:hypothetical protein
MAEILATGLSGSPIANHYRHGWHFRGKTNQDLIAYVATKSSRRSPATAAPDAQRTLTHVLCRFSWL